MMAGCKCTISILTSIRMKYKTKETLFIATAVTVHVYVCMQCAQQDTLKDLSMTLFKEKKVQLEFPLLGQLAGFGNN